MYVALINPAKKSVARGVNTRSLFDGSSTPNTLEGLVPRAVRSAGNVKAIMTGRLDCKEKYIGKMAAWRVEN